ncbi:helix-turn-helix domain-containing protein [Kribbella qitaiheensis]|uniref:helix-turn-helix domain-containing protein n=1 Tax=Kribbella qitaiheensis TaxID=1544730 RepID=UPI001624DDD3|nr:helix-turn-helix transcriptional regulator [Kribbella qitaiheensis]
MATQTVTIHRHDIKRLLQAAVKARTLERFAAGDAHTAVIMLELMNTDKEQPPTTDEPTRVAPALRVECSPPPTPTRRDALANRRREVCKTQESLAMEIGVQRSTVARWESGDTTPSLWARPRIANALGVTLDLLDVLLINLVEQNHPQIAKDDVVGPVAAPMPPPVRDAKLGADADDALRLSLVPGPDSSASLQPAPPTVPQLRSTPQPLSHSVANRPDLDPWLLRAVPQPRRSRSSRDRSPDDGRERPTVLIMIDTDLQAELLRRMEPGDEGRRTVEDHTDDPRTTQWEAVIMIDQSEAAWLSRVVTKTGWPLHSAVGEQATTDAWLLAQHAVHEPETQRVFHQQMTTATTHSEAAPRLLVYLGARIRVNAGRPQLYISQFESDAAGTLRLQPIGPRRFGQLAGNGRTRSDRRALGHDVQHLEPITRLVIGADGRSATVERQGEVRQISRRPSRGTRDHRFLLLCVLAPLREPAMVPRLGGALLPVDD